MKSGGTVFCIDSVKYIYLECVGSEKGGIETTTRILLGVDSSRNEENDQEVGIFNLIQKNPNTVVHLKEDKAC